MKEMKSRRAGVVTVVSSTGGLRGSIGMAPYVASKHAVLGLMKCAALEGADALLRINAVNPGPTETRMMRSIEQATGTGAQTSRTRTETGIPLKRLGTPQEVAAMIAFLSSDEAGFATGGTYLIDGGLLAGRAR